jgi:hypothetical protein
MRDKKDNATFDLPGFAPAAPLEPEAKRPPPPRAVATLKQEQWNCWNRPTPPVCRSGCATKIST